MFSVPLLLDENLGKVCENSWGGENPDWVSGLWVTDLLSNSPKSSPRLSPGYEGTKNVFCFWNVTQAAPAIFA